MRVAGPASGAPRVQWVFGERIVLRTGPRVASAGTPTARAMRASVLATSSSTPVMATSWATLAGGRAT
jgi:hypothetical protein